MVLSEVAVFLIITLGGVQGQFPENTVAAVGDTATLRCEYQTKSCSQIRWEKRASGQTEAISFGSTVYDGSKYRLDVWSFCDLVIKNVQLPDSGTFVCIYFGGSKSWSADLIVLQAKPSCSTSCDSDSTAEGDIVDVKCKLTYRGGGRPEMTWLNKQTQSDIPDVPPQQLDGSTVSRDFSGNVGDGGVAPMVCLTRFYFDETFEKASNDPEVRCETKSCSIGSDVDDVDLKNKKKRTKTIAGASSGAVIVVVAIIVGIVYVICNGGGLGDMSCDCCG